MLGSSLQAASSSRLWSGVCSVQYPNCKKVTLTFAGFPFSFGVFQVFYTSHEPFSAHPNGIAAIGTCSSGVMYLIAPISLYILDAWPSVRRLSSIFGLILVTTALVASSFATEVWQLILTQGILYATGGSFLYAPTMFYLDEWFVKKKGLAFGIMWAGVGTVSLLRYLSSNVAPYF